MKRNDLHLLEELFNDKRLRVEILPMNNGKDQWEMVTEKYEGEAGCQCQFPDPWGGSVRYLVTREGQYWLYDEI